MISRSGVHLPDTTYDGKPIAWKDADDSDEELRRLRAENAKLRELVRDMWFWHYEGHIDSESQERQMKHIDRVIDCMHELGVDDG